MLSQISDLFNFSERSSRLKTMTTSHDHDHPDFKASDHIPPISPFTEKENFSTVLMEVEPARFSTIDKSSIDKLVRENDRKWLRDNGGVEGILLALETDAETGIRGDLNDIHDRKVTFEDHNTISDHHMTIVAWKSIGDPMILILLFCSILSVGFGIKKHGLKQGWQEGVASLAAILATIVISSAGNSWPAFQCFKFSEIGNHIPEVDVLRNKKWQQISICRVVVGDIVSLKPGDQVPADGLFVEGCSLHVETPGPPRDQIHSHDNPFLVSGSAVSSGYARMVVTAAVGKNKNPHTICFRGTVLDDITKIAYVVEKIVKVVGWISFAWLLWEFCSGDYVRDEHNYDHQGITDWAAMVRIVATPVMITLSSSPEGLVMALKMGFAYSMKRMMGISVLVRFPSMCHSVASLTTLCVNKTGTLTTDSMEVDEVWQGLNRIDEAPLDLISTNVVELLCQGIGYLSTTPPPSRSTDSASTSASSTEKAIFDWAVRQLGLNVETLKRSCTAIEIEPFNSRNRSSGVLISVVSPNSAKMTHVHKRGAPDVIIPLCSHYYESNGKVRVINETVKALWAQILDGMAENGLRCFALAHRKTSIRDYFTNFSGQKLILLGFVGLKNPRRIGTRETVQECLEAGVNIKLITGDSLKTATYVAAKCGILKPGQYSPEEMVLGSQFRQFTDEEKMARIDNIRVLAMATPEDKFLMVQCLKKKGHVVGYLGQGIGDVKALREANVALCFGTQGAENAKACSAMVLRCKDFILIVEILKWGRGLYHSIQTYSQFLITATCVALITEFVTTVIYCEPASRSNPLGELVATGRAPYPVFQLVWVKLIMGTLSALALVIKPPADSLMLKPPTSEKDPLITSFMRTNIGIQVMYQLSMLLTIYFMGSSIFHATSDEKNAMILTTYILCQVIAMSHSYFSDKTNIFEEMQNNKTSWGITALIILVQVLMLQVLKNSVGTVSLSWGQWGACITMAASSFLVSELIRNLSALKNIIKWRSFMKPKAD